MEISGQDALIFKTVDIGFTAGPQMLHGTYGGEQGRLITFPDDLRYGFYSIDACAQQLIVMQYQSRTPHRSSVDGIGYVL